MTKHRPTSVATCRTAVVGGWLAAIAYAAGLAWLGIKDVAGNPLAAHADAFQHVYWMQRFLDPALYPGDTLSDYFADVAPRGFTALYWVFAQLGVGPLFLSKLLPVALAVVTTAFLFPLALRLFPVPAAAWLTAVLANQSFWMSSTLGSGTPRAFLYPIFTAFLLAVVLRAHWGIILTVVLMALFYPPFLLVMAALLAVRAWRDPALHLPGLTVALACLAAYGAQTGGHGPTLTAAEAHTMPEFQPGGFRAFFHAEPWRFWVTDGRSGLFPGIERKPVLLFAAGLLPLLALRTARFPLTCRLEDRGRLLLELTAVSLGLYALAHLALFRLYLPARYTEHTFVLAAALAAGPALVILLDALTSRFPMRQAGWLAAAVLLLVTPLAPDFWRRFPIGFYQEGPSPALYRFVATTPRHARIASLSREADFLPALARRQVLVNARTNPYHTGHYQLMRERMGEQIEAHYTTSPTVLATFLDRHAIDFVVLDRQAFSPFYLTNHTWVRQFEPASSQAIAVLARGQRPAMAALASRCTLYATADHLVLDARKLLIEAEAQAAASRPSRHPGG